MEEPSTKGPRECEGWTGSEISADEEEEKEEDGPAWGETDAHDVELDIGVS